MKLNDQTVLGYYSQPAAMTSAGRYVHLLADLPPEVGSLTEVAQGLLIHEHMAHGYGVELSDAERNTVHLRRVTDLLAHVVARDPRPLQIAREPAGRVPANCRHFSVLMVAMLRAQGIPARARCGFGGYFKPGSFEDHWVCEYWDATRRRWALVDAQVDDRQRGWFGIDFDVTDVPRDQFIVAGQAWTEYRAGRADPGRFGLSLAGEAGDWWIAGNLMRDAAALRNVELLPWDSWGAMPGPATPIGDELASLFDLLAVLTQEPDATAAELRRLCNDDDRLRLPAQVRNHVRDRNEPLDLEY